MSSRCSLLSVLFGQNLTLRQTTWDASQRKGSLSIYIWESTDLINWGSERLVKVENDLAGMVWAPDAIWDTSKGEKQKSCFLKRRRLY